MDRQKLCLHFEATTARAANAKLQLSKLCAAQAAGLVGIEIHLSYMLAG